MMTNKAQTNKTLIENKIGRKMWVWGSDSFYMQRLLSGPYQKLNLLRMRELCPNPRTVIDIGMNIGMNTWEYATFAEAVHGFEPVPTTFDMANENIRLNKENYREDTGWFPTPDGFASLEITGDIHTYNVALGPNGGPDKVEMQIRKNDGHNRVANDNFNKWTGRKWIPRTSFNTSYQRVEIEQRTLDSYNFNDVDYIKIDVEGYELQVLLGASDTIERNRPIVQIECVENQPRTFGSKIQEIMDYFNERDYVITTADGTELGPDWTYVKGMMDRFMIPREKHIPNVKEEVFNTLFK